MKIKKFIKKGIGILALAGAVAVNCNPKPFNPEEKYAVLINGSEERGFAVMEMRTYDNLLKMGFEKKNIYTLDHSGNQENTASKKNVEKMFSSLERIVDENDLLVVYFLDHGNRITIFQDGIPKKVSVVVLEDKYLNEDEIYNYLSKIHPKTGIVTTDTCYGGGIAKRVGKGNFIGISSSDENESALFFYSQSFMSEFYAAFREKEADVNNDGKVTIKEAFDYNQIYVDALPRKVTPLLISEIDPDSVTLE